MALYLLLGILLFLALALHYLLVAQGRWIVGPETFFLLMAFGTYVATASAALAVGEPQSDYVVYIGIGTLCFVAGTATARLVLDFGHRNELAAFRERPWRHDLRGVVIGAALVAGVASLAMLALHYWWAGGLVPVSAFLVLLRQGPEAMAAAYNELRLAPASGTYLGPGYAAQLRNAVLPVVTLLCYFRYRVEPALRWGLLFALFLGATILVSLGTGARFPLAFFGLAFLLVGHARLVSPLRFHKRMLFAVAGGLFALLSALTLMMGTRQQDVLEVPFLWAPYQVIERVFVSPSAERFDVYRWFLANEEPRWGGGLAEQLQIVLPGRAEYTLSNQLHELVYGNPLGDVGLDFWGSTWLDFRWLGLVVAAAFGFLSHAFYVWLVRGPKRLSRVPILLYSGIILGLATDLQVLLLRGFLTCLLLLAGLRVVELMALAGRAPGIAGTRRVAPLDA
jgi:hypothetical protein